MDVNGEHNELTEDDVAGAETPDGIAPTFRVPTTCVAVTSAQPSEFATGVHIEALGFWTRSTNVLFGLLEAAAICPTAALPSAGLAPASERTANRGPPCWIREPPHAF